MKNLIFVFLLFSFKFSFSQEKTFEFLGRATKNGKPMAGVKVVLFKTGVKVSEMTTNKNGKYDYELEVGFDYKIVFSASGHIEQYLTIAAAKVKESERFIQGYEGETVMWELTDPTINVSNFKNPYTKIIPFKNGKADAFTDEEPYFTNFIKSVKVDLEKISRDEEERIANEKTRKEKERAEKLQLQTEENARQEQLSAAQKKALQEAEAQEKMLAEKKRLEDEKLQASSKKTNTLQLKEEKKNNANVSLNLQISLEKEQKKIKEKQNQKVKATYENELIQMVAENERMSQEQKYKKQKATAYSNEVIETMRLEAEIKGKSDEINFTQKQKAKLSILNTQIKNTEITSLVKNAASNEKEKKIATIKTYPKVASYKPKNPVGVSTRIEDGKFKSIYIIDLYIDGVTFTYRKEKYNWGTTYLYKNNKEISELQYKSELSIYKVPL
jgi:5-hydroxyisourate hydrolase-like protein (transthyretin family)